MTTMTPDEAFLRLSALCARGEHCRHDALAKMRQWGLSVAEREAVADRLVRERYIDEERYCRAFVRDKTVYNKWGRRKVEQALWQKHISRDVAAQVLDELTDADYAGVLLPLLQQKRRSLRGCSDREQRQKLMRFALSRGFTPDIIRQCLDLSDDEAELLDMDS